MYFFACKVIGRWLTWAFELLSVTLPTGACYDHLIHSNFALATEGGKDSSAYRIDF